MSMPAKSQSRSQSHSQGQSQSQSQVSRNVVIIIGQSGVGKSSLINMLCPEAEAPTSIDMVGCTREENAYRCDLGSRRTCQIHDTVGLEEGFLGFLWAPKAEKRLKKYLKEKRPHLLVYCMPGARGSLKKSHGRNFNKFKSVVGQVPVVVVVTNLEDSGAPLERWWSDNRDELQRLNIPVSTEHACVTTLPEAYLRPERKGLYNTSRAEVKALIRSNLPNH